MKELHGQTLSNEIAESDRLAAGIPGQVAAKNILFSKFWAQLKAKFATNNWEARTYESSPAIVVVDKKQYILDESVAPLPYTSTDFTTELASGIWLPLGSSITLASQLEAESNTENTKFLSSLRTFQNWYNNVKTYVITELNTVSKTIVGALNYFNNNVLITKEPTGFVNPDSVNVSYDGATRKVTLTGSVEAYYRGNLITALVSGWVSDAHNVADGTYFLYYNGTAFVWSNSQWPFDAVMIAMAYRDGSNFCLRECHGLMAWQTHQELHETLGTYLKSGGDLSGFTLASTTAANRRPQISSAIVKDEDLGTTLPTLTTNAYSRLFLSGANTANISVDQTEIIALLANNPYYNQFTGGNWVQTLFPNNAYGKIFIMAIPVTSDVDCQKKRFIFIQPQTVSTTLATIQAITSSSVNLGHIAASLAEYVFIGEIIVRFAANNWTIISTAKLVGTKVVQASIIGGGGGGASTAADLAVDATGFNGNLLPTDTNQQSVNQKFDDLVFKSSDITRTATITLSSTNQESTNIELDTKITEVNTSVNEIIISGSPSAIIINKLNSRYADYTLSANFQIDINNTLSISGCSVIVPIKGNGTNTLIITGCANLNGTEFVTTLDMLNVYMFTKIGDSVIGNVIARFIKTDPVPLDELVFTTLSFITKSLLTYTSLAGANTWGLFGNNATKVINSGSDGFIKVKISSVSAIGIGIGVTTAYSNTSLTTAGSKYAIFSGGTDTDLYSTINGTAFPKATGSITSGSFLKLQRIAGVLKAYYSNDNEVTYTIAKDFGTVSGDLYANLYFASNNPSSVTNCKKG